jgi:hypothetical protein
MSESINAAIVGNDIANSLNIFCVDVENTKNDGMIFDEVSPT